MRPPVETRVPYKYLGAICMDVPEDASSLLPYAHHILGQNTVLPTAQKVLLLPPGLGRSAFLNELSHMDAIDIGPREEMLAALEEGHRQAQEDRARLT